MQKIFDDQVAYKLTEDRAQLMGDGSSEWNVERPSSSNNHNVSVDELRSRQKQMLGGNLYL